jgi:uncharacterized protein (TIGR00251 family)
MKADSPEGVLTQRGDDLLLQIKVVPGASSDRVAGLLGDRLKVAVVAPPEAGKANKAVCELIANWLGLSKRQVQILAGPTQPLKTLKLEGIDPEHVEQHIATLDRA